MSDTPTASSSGPWFAVSMGLLGLIIGYGLSGLHGGTSAQVAQAPAQVPPSAAAPQPTAPSNPPDIAGNPVLGNTKAPVTLIEFSDYQCPFCQRHYTQTFGQIKKDYVDTGKVKYVLRDYPLSFHPNAEPAAEAAECAGDQGKYWDMHAALFQNHDTWSNAADAKPFFTQYAKDMGLDVAKFTACIQGGSKKAEIQKDLADGQNAGIQGTPGFWVIGPDGKGEMISGAQPYDVFKTAIEKYLK